MHPDTVQILAGGPPTMLNGFRLSEPSAPASMDILAVEFALSCRECANDRFELLTHIKIAPDPSPYAEVAPGAAFFQPPHFGRCTNCGHQAKVFDARTDGYDAVLNQVAGYESGVGDPTLLPGSRSIKVLCLYNTDLAELAEIAEADKVRMVDLFDWVDINAVADGGEPPFSEGYELA